MEYLKTIGSLAGLISLFWNIYSTYYSRRGKLEVSLGWSTNLDDQETCFEIMVVNLGIDTRVIKSVYIKYLDDVQQANTRNSTTAYIKVLPGLALKRGEMGVEKIFYKKDRILENILLNRQLYFYIIDTFGKEYRSDSLNTGGISLPLLVR